MLRGSFLLFKKPINIHNTLNLPLLPGQPIYHPDVEDELRKNPYFSNPPEIKDTSEQILEKISDIFGSKKHSLFFINGSYRHALDVALINAVEKEDIILLIGDSPWHRSLQKRLLFFCNGADIFPLPDLLTKETLKTSLENLATQIEEKPYKIVVVPHAIESSNQLIPVDEIAKIVNSVNSFVLLDAHTTAGATPIDQTNRFDVVVASSNWGLASAPGMGLLAISEELTADIEAQQRDLPPTLDLDYWQTLTEDLNKGYIPESFEFAPNELRALNTSLELILKNKEDYQLLQAHNAFIIRMLLLVMGFNLRITKGISNVPEKTHKETGKNNDDEQKKTEKSNDDTPNETTTKKKEKNNESDDIDQLIVKLRENLEKFPLTPTYTTFQLSENIDPGEFYQLLLKQKLIIRLVNEKSRTYQIGHIGYLTSEHIFGIARAFLSALKQSKIEQPETIYHVIEGIIGSLV